MLFSLLLIPLFHATSVLLLNGYERDKTQWWFMHALCNVVTMQTTWNDTLKIWNGNSNVARGASYHPSLFSISVHVYHAIFFSTTMEDRIHHSLFAILLGIPTILYPSVASNASLFFLTGGPGFVIYSLLVLKKCGVINAVDKRVHVLVNVVRCAGLLACVYRFAKDVGSSDVPFPIFLLQSLLTSTNGIVYASMSMMSLFRERRRPCYDAAL